jgi:hypothetical protein
VYGRCGLTGGWRLERRPAVRFADLVQAVSTSITACIGVDSQARVRVVQGTKLAASISGDLTTCLARRAPRTLSSGARFDWVGTQRGWETGDRRRFEGDFGTFRHTFRPGRGPLLRDF